MKKHEQTGGELITPQGLTRMTNWRHLISVLQLLKNLNKHFKGGWVGHVRQWRMTKNKLNLAPSHVTLYPPHIH